MIEPMTPAEFAEWQAKRLQKIGAGPHWSPRPRGDRVEADPEPLSDEELSVEVDRHPDQY